MLQVIVDWWPVGVGTGLGVAYARYVGCRSGGECPITTNAYVAGVYGAVAGYVASFFVA